MHVAAYFSKKSVSGAINEMENITADDGELEVEKMKFLYNNNNNFLLNKIEQLAVMLLK
jgi:hypothetical protein